MMIWDQVSIYKVWGIRERFGMKGVDRYIRLLKMLAIVNKGDRVDYPFVLNTELREKNITYKLNDAEETKMATYRDNILKYSNIVFCRHSPLPFQIEILNKFRDNQITTINSSISIGTTTVFNSILHHALIQGPGMKLLYLTPNKIDAYCNCEAFKKMFYNTPFYMRKGVTDVGDYHIRFEDGSAIYFEIYKHKPWKKRSRYSVIIADKLNDKQLNNNFNSKDDLSRIISHTYKGTKVIFNYNIYQGPVENNTSYNFECNPELVNGKYELMKIFGDDTEELLYGKPSEEYIKKDIGANDLEI